MESFSISDVSSQELDNCLKSISKDHDSPLLRNDLSGYDSQELIKETLKLEEELEAKKRSSVHSFISDNSPTGFNPSTVIFPGNYNFKAEPDNSRTDKAWMYSSILKKVFIDVNKVLVMKFSLNSYVNHTNFYLRALPVFSSCDFSQIPVTRCPAHTKKDDPDFKAHFEGGRCFCIQYNLAGHVLRCQSQTAQYQFDASSGRHNVIIPLPVPQPGADSISVPFSFACKTSCASGMQRRPIVIIFTLENEFCEVIGRQLVAVKICACPKRDIERLERDYYESGESINVPKGKHDDAAYNKKRERSVKRSAVVQTMVSDYLTNKKKSKTSLVQLSSDTDNSDYEVENVKKDLEYVLQIMKQQEQQNKELSEKIIRMYTKIKRVKNSNLNCIPSRNKDN